MTYISGQTSFVKTNGNSLEMDGSRYCFLGTNFWYGMNLGSEGEGGNRARLLRELDHLHTLGITNLRIMGASEGPDNQPWRMLPSLQTAPGEFNNDLFKGLDFLLWEMGKRQMVAVICLNNFWPWSGGMAQYMAWETGDSIPYPPPAEGGDWLSYQLFTAKFYANPAARNRFEAFLKVLLDRKNAYSGKAYRNDPTIMAWEVANEPRGILSGKKYREWVEQTAQLIKSHAPNHLITIGSEGWTPSRFAGNHFKKDHLLPNIDYATLHIWVQNWGWYDPQKAEISYPKAIAKAKKYLRKHLRQAQQMGIPVVLEEFGISRDLDDHDPASSTTIRDQFYSEMFEEIVQQAEKGRIAGCNFWAWGGEGRPRSPKTVWKAGDDFIGDPPHEYQGWYSVYDKDKSTLRILKTYVQKLADITKKKK
ncbi:MAG: cellulase family glycosylhydrolase [Bacteroidota bacterium]